MMRNKRGHLPTIMLLIAGVIIFISAWISFLSFKDTIYGELSFGNELIQQSSFGKNYVGAVFFDSVEKAIKESDETNFKENFERIVAERDFNVIQAGNFFAKVRNKDYILVKEGERYKLEIMGVESRIKIENSEVRLKFNLEHYFELLTEDL